MERVRQRIVENYFMKYYENHYFLNNYVLFNNTIRQDPNIVVLASLESEKQQLLLLLRSSGLDLHYKAIQGLSSGSRCRQHFCLF